MLEAEGIPSAQQHDYHQLHDPCSVFLLVLHGPLDEVVATMEAAEELLEPQRPLSELLL